MKPSPPGVLCSHHFTPLVIGNERGGVRAILYRCTEAKDENGAARGGCGAEHLVKHDHAATQPLD